ncbi:unnamed protein product [Periconia digitata]|uniref:Large ribosomal subunit protein mL50 n=1 Tax=Periconia digitata TaxID=1303443 RepID=A0A9W4UPY2_9PLEO|nr:unnamed protein product [Periconia digitata]
MRRIPPPQRAIDRSLSIPNSLRHQSPFSQCRRATSPHPLLRTTYASFSTTPNLSFILAKQDKKKHQQLVRRWQKRLLGESEPIGAHVDPFDPTSPVRIAPEDQGDELEVLADDEAARELDAIYEEEVNGERLRRVGGDKWLDQREESQLAREYEKLTMRTYTPMSHTMADQIEDLTGTMYSLRDDNLMMAQKFHDFGNKPYTDWSFGQATPIRDLPTIRSKFHQAVIEIYTLKHARQFLDLTGLANRGVYDVPKWIQDAKLLQIVRGPSKGRYTVAFPDPKQSEDLLKAMRHVPSWSNQQEWSSEQELLQDVEAAVEEEVSPAEEPAPEMDPNTPAFKRAAMVKQDPDQKPFDFMSNRPVPRTPPQNPPVNVTIDAGEPVAVKADVSPSTSPIVDADSAKTPGQPVEPEKIKDVTEQQAAPSKKRPKTVEVKWRDVPLVNIEEKFALAKRMRQLTGLLVSDPTLTSLTTLGELYHHLCADSKPKPSKLFSYLHIEGQQQAEAAKKAAAQQTSNAPTPTKANLGTLLKLKNVELHRKRPNAKDLRTKKGLSKVITKELRTGGLGAGPSQPGFRASMKERSYVKRETKLIEGTKVAPTFGVAVSPTAAQLLKDRTQRKKQEWYDQDKSWKQVDMLIRERKFAPVESKSQL